MNKTLQALALGAATSFSASAALAQESGAVNETPTISQEQREATAKVMGECVGNRVYGGLQVASLFVETDNLNFRKNELIDFEVMIKLNALVICFADAVGYERVPLEEFLRNKSVLYHQAPDLPEVIKELPDDIDTNQQAQEDLLARATGGWQPLMDREVDEDVFEKTYESTILAARLLR